MERPQTDGRPRQTLRGPRPAVQSILPGQTHEPVAPQGLAHRSPERLGRQPSALTTTHHTPRTTHHTPRHRSTRQRPDNAFHHIPHAGPLHRCRSRHSQQPPDGYAEPILSAT